MTSGHANLAFYLLQINLTTGIKQYTNYALLKEWHLKNNSHVECRLCCLILKRRITTIEITRYDLLESDIQHEILYYSQHRVEQYLALLCLCRARRALSCYLYRCLVFEIIYLQKNFQTQSNFFSTPYTKALFRSNMALLSHRKYVYKQCDMDTVEITTGHAHKLLNF